MKMRASRCACRSFIPAVLVACAPTGTADAEDIDARHWFNNPTFRINDDRCVILFFFTCDDRESAKWADRLRDTSRRPDAVVIGLTADNRSATERFIERTRIGFTVGAGSQSAKKFRVEKLPAILLVRRDRPGQWQPATIESLATLLPAWRDPIADLTDEESLRAYVESDADGPSRAAALRKLWTMLEPARRVGMIQLASERLSVEPDPWVRGQLRYYRDRAQGISRPDAEPTASARYFRDYRANPNDPKWASVKALQPEMGRAAPPELLGYYNAHRGDAPADVLVRRLATFEIAKGATDRSDDAAYLAQARAALLEILPQESDASIRMLATIGLSKACQVGDVEAIAYLESLARTEPDDFRVRPALERVAHQLRTGATSGPVPPIAP